MLHFDTGYPSNYQHNWVIWVFLSGTDKY